MNKEQILSTIKDIKPIYEEQGLILVGLFGSYARDEATQDSDIDLLYKLNSAKFFDNESDWGGGAKLDTIKSSLEKIFHNNIDLCTINNPSRTFQKFALKDAIYV